MCSHVHVWDVFWVPTFKILLFLSCVGSTTLDSHHGEIETSTIWEIEDHDDADDDDDDEKRR